VMSGSSVTCFTSSGGGGGNAGDVTSVGASGSGVSASIPAGAGATGLAIFACGLSWRSFHLWLGRGGRRVGKMLWQNW
jgi:hypothetical protein